MIILDPYSMFVSLRRSWKLSGVSLRKTWTRDFLDLAGGAYLLGCQTMKHGSSFVMKTERVWETDLRWGGSTCLHVAMLFSFYFWCCIQHVFCCGLHGLETDSSRPPFQKTRSPSTVWRASKCHSTPRYRIFGFNASHWQTDAKTARCSDVFMLFYIV